jgi:hypothetical protein
MSAIIDIDAWYTEQLNRLALECNHEMVGANTPQECSLVLFQYIDALSKLHHIYTEQKRSRINRIPEWLRRLIYRII